MITKCEVKKSRHIYSNVSITICLTAILCNILNPSILITFAFTAIGLVVALTILKRIEKLIYEKHFSD